jgi:hypothetical protein
MTVMMNKVAVYNVNNRKSGITKIMEGYDERTEIVWENLMNM